MDEEMMSLGLPSFVHRTMKPAASLAGTIQAQNTLSGFTVQLWKVLSTLPNVKEFLGPFISETALVHHVSLDYHCPGSNLSFQWTCEW